MPIPVGRAAAAAFRRFSRPAVGSIHPLFGKTCYRPSVRMSDEPYQKLSEQIESMSISQAIHAKRMIDMKLGKAGIVELTGDDAFRAFRDEMRQGMKAQRLVSADHQKLLLQVLNKKGDLASVTVGKLGTLNVIGLLTLLFKVHEIWPLTPVVEDGIKYIKRFF